MTFISLDNFIKNSSLSNELFSSGSLTYIFVDSRDLISFYEKKGKSVNFEKLYLFLKKKFGVDTIINLYLPIFNQDLISSDLFRKQSEFVQNLKCIGYSVVFTAKYRLLRQQIEKGNEVAIVSDLIHYARFFKKAIVICGDFKKYRKIVQFLDENYDVSLQLYSLMLEIEDNYEEFLELIECTSDPLDNSSEFSTLDSSKDLFPRFHDDLKRLYPKDLRSRMNVKNRQSVKGSGGKTVLFIDYGNLHHQLPKLKEVNCLLKKLSEIEFFKLLKSKANELNIVDSIELFMGIPDFSTSLLDHMKQKIEKFLVELKKESFNVHFTYNQNRFEGGMEESGVDLRIAAMAVHLVLSSSIKKIVLVSGDADFIPLVKKLVSLGIFVEVWSFTEPLSSCPLSPLLYYEINNNLYSSSVVRSLNALLHF